MKYLPVAGRVLFTPLFLGAGFAHFAKEPIQHAAASGVPMADLLVPVSGVLALIGGFSILLGYKARWGAWAIVAFMLPVTFMMHPFWAFTDPMQHQIHQVMFMKNITITGAALLIAYFGAGPVSLDARKKARFEGEPEKLARSVV
ncbi:DoxX family protein [Larkinella soli]|uniref:DoxX family protein n=1 Tax=Larkinella soli TaxID=1770527 RepID=UPI000FFB2030|nr:DoxX family protein [Larkinella soli]